MATKFTAAQGPHGNWRVLKEGAPLTLEQVQAEVLNLLASIDEKLTPREVTISGPVIHPEKGVLIEQPIQAPTPSQKPSGQPQGKGKDRR